MSLGKLLLVLIYFIEFAAHLRISSTHLASENVTTLGGGTSLTFDATRAISVDFGNHLHLVGVVHHKLFGVSSISRGPVASRNNFGLRSDCWNFVIILLNW